jgi:hypothetical protein
MFARLALAASLALGSLLPQHANADALGPCALLTGSVADVKAHKTEQHFGKVTMSRVDGASLFLRAQPGLSAEWLERSLAQHIASMKNMSMPDCPLEAKDLRVSVRPAGTGYWVTIRAQDRDQAELVLERAKALHDGLGSTATKPMQARPSAMTPGISR